MKQLLFSLFIVVTALSVYSQSGTYLINDRGYFEREGINVMVFSDTYPEGHQGGITLIMHGMRMATNGDLRLDETPGQWQPVPRMQKRNVDPSGNTISVNLTYPDSARDRKGFNPIVYPDLYFNYTIHVRAEGDAVIIAVDLDRPLPEEFEGKVGFNLELFPGRLFGKSWYFDSRSGIFPPQPVGPAAKMASGKSLVIAPENDLMRLSIESKKEELQLLDGRYRHNNGWFIVRSPIAKNTTEKVVEWVITPNAIPGWLYDPVVQVSQIGYHPSREKIAIIEKDKRDNRKDTAKLYRISENGEKIPVLSGLPQEAGQFLRYNYAKFDFSEIEKEGVYVVEYGDYLTHPFRIAADVYKQQIWQPTLEYFLPVQMCHMTVKENYRVWHGQCHMDDALMAPLNHNHFDGYNQGNSTFTSFEPGEHVPNLNTGGWHDAGDYDLRVESQSREIYTLTLIWEAFNIPHDETSIDQESRSVEIHQPDGQPDILQQIEHGALTIISGYNSLGRLYRGIICPTLPQYVLLGDGSTMTDGLTGNEESPDDRWVFTEDNPGREYQVAAHLAAASRSLKRFNDTLSRRCLRVAEEIFNIERPVRGRAGSAKIHAATELFLTTGKEKYKDYLTENEESITRHIRSTGWLIGRVLPLIGNEQLTNSVTQSLRGLHREITVDISSTPYGIPYHPRVWGPGWDIQRFGVSQYYLHESFPEIFPDTSIFNALNFILGVHPGSNTASFASGIGSKSNLVAYGVNRADWSYIPGGVASGTGLIRPDFPELLDFPFLWQQQEYCIGGPATNFMFLVLAADKLTTK